MKRINLFISFFVCAHFLLIPMRVDPLYQKKLNVMIASLIDSGVSYQRSAKDIFFTEAADIAGDCIITQVQPEAGKVLVEYVRQQDSGVSDFISAVDGWWVKNQDEKTFTIGHVYTAEEFQRKKFATKTLSSLWPKLEMAGFSTVELKSLAYCISLYTKHGFKVKNQTLCGQNIFASQQLIPMYKTLAAVSSINLQ